MNADLTTVNRKRLFSAILVLGSLAFIFVISTAIASAGLMNSAWPKFKHDSNQTGQSPYPSFSNSTLKWSQPVRVVSGPTIDSNGVIYVGGQSNIIYAIYPNGTQKWTFATAGGSIYQSPLIDSNGVIYSGTGQSSGSGTCPGGSNNVYAIYPNGTQKWGAALGFPSVSSFAMDLNGIIYITAGSYLYGTCAYAYFSNNGTMKWSKFFSGAYVYNIYTSSPAIDSNGIIYFGIYKNLYALYPDGTQKWTFATGNNIYSSPAIDSNGVIYVGSNDNNLYAIYPNGSKKWNVAEAANVRSSPAIDSNGVIYSGDYNGDFYAFYPNGTQKWKVSIGSLNQYESPAIDSNGIIYIGDSSGNFYAFYPNGTQKWMYPTYYSLYSPAIDSNGVVYVGNIQNFYAFDSQASKTATTTAVSSSSNPSVYGQAVTFTATVTSSSATGTVQFSIDGTNFGSPMVLSGGTAVSQSNSSLPVGTHTVAASYNGDSNYAGSTGYLTQTVNKSNTTTAISTISPSSPKVNQAYIVSFTVAATSPGSGNPTGTVTVSDGTNSCSATPPVGNCSLTSNTAGTKTITASYSGDTNFNPSSGTPSLIISKISTTTTISSSSNPSMYGQTVTFTATVSSSSGNVPDGETLTFDDGSSILGTAIISSGNATYSTSFLSAGSHSISAVYPGDTSFLSSTRSMVQQVNQSIPVTYWSNPADITYGTPLSGTQLDASASVPGTFVYNPPSGTVLPAGDYQTLSTRFTPYDTANYTDASVSVTINVSMANITIVWQNPVDISYGTPLNSTQLNARAIDSLGNAVPGSFYYNPSAGTILGAGDNQTLLATFTPNDASNYSSASAEVSINVTKSTPLITWSNPANIAYGTPLSTTQLDASAVNSISRSIVSGNFTYTPTAGTTLDVGTYTLQTDFVTIDDTNYTNASANATITVVASPPQNSNSFNLPSGYGKYISPTFDAGTNVTFSSIQLNGTFNFNNIEVYTTYSIDNKTWFNWTQTNKTENIYSVASGEYSRYFEYMILAPSGTNISGVTISYVVSPDGVIYID